MATAELAVALLAVVAVLVPVVSGVQMLVGQMRAEQAAFAVARMAARGDPSAASRSAAATVHPAAQVGMQRDGSRVVVSVELPVRLAVGPTITVRARASAAAEGQ